MISIRPWCALVLVCMVSAARAEDKPPSPWAIDRSVTISPQPAPIPALKYRLMPLSSTLKEGNAVPIYLRLVHEQNDAARKYWTETPKQWNALPLDKIPANEAHKFLEGMRNFTRQIEVGARRRTAEWNYTIEEPNPIGMLLPDVQWMRNYAPLIVLQARVALAEKKYDAAIHHLETGFAFSRHVGDGPTLINRLVGMAVANQFATALTDEIELPNRPNLYWALATLPRPLIDLRTSLEWEYRVVEMQIPELADPDHDRAPEYWDRVLKRVRSEFQLLGGLNEGGNVPAKSWFPKNCAPEAPASKSPDLPAARKYVAGKKGWSAEQSEKMPAAQALLIYMQGIYQEDRDDWYRASYLRYPQALSLFEAASKRLRDAPITEAHLPARLLLSAMNRVMSRQNLLERNLAALQAIEALKIYAASHGGKFPEKLSDVVDAPIPPDPATDKPFEYSVENGTATLSGPTSEAKTGGRPSSNGVRYRVTLR